jgi:hypothetical protein
MKMIRHEAVANDISIGRQLFPNLFYEKYVIATVKKNRLLVIAPVVNMIKFVLGQVHGTADLA